MHLETDSNGCGWGVNVEITTSTSVKLFALIPFASSVGIAGSCAVDTGITSKISLQRLDAGLIEEIS